MTEWFEDPPVEPRGRPPLFAWLDMVGVAATRKQLTAQRAGIALLVANTTTSLTGEGAVIDAGRLSAETGLSERQVWRHFAALVEAGWFLQTARPRRGAKGQYGARARYRLTLPALDLALVSESDRLPSPREEVSHDGPPRAESSDTFDLNRLTLWTQPSDIAERENGTVLSSNGSSSNGPSSSSDFEVEPQTACEFDELTPSGRAQRDSAHLARIAESRRLAREGVRRALGQ